MEKICLFTILSLIVFILSADFVIDNNPHDSKAAMDYELTIANLKVEINQLKDENFQLKHLLDNVPGDVYWKNNAGVWLGVNQNCLDSLTRMGFIEKPIAAHVLGKTDYELFNKSTAERYHINDEEVLRSQNKITIEEITELPDGSKITLLSTKVPLRNLQMEAIGIIGITIDITQLKLIEHDLKIAKKKAEAADKAKAEFIANMSHDIRTPLSGIIGLSGILEDEVAPGEQKEHAHMLNISGEQLLSLLNSVMDIVVSGTTREKDINLSSFNLEEMLHNIFELELPALHLKSIKLNLELDSALPKWVESDKGKIYRILLNLLSNAIKFTHNGSITLSAKIVEHLDDKFITEFKIKDTGIGIDQKDQARIFEKFYRGNPSYEGKYDGHGIGLHIVRKYISLLHGKISVSSIKDEGTCISFTLPMKSGHSISSAAVITPSPLAAIHSNNYQAKILLVEDNPMAMKVASLLTKKLNCATTEAFNSSDALKLCKNQAFDFILTDIGLPDFSGYVLTQKLHDYQTENNLALTPVIGLTAHAKAEAEVQGLSSGMAAIHEKPLRKEVLQELINKYATPKINEAFINLYTQYPLFNIEEGIEQLGNIDALKEVVQMMIDNDFKNTLPAIALDFAQKDWQQFKNNIHKFKSSCLYCPTTRLLKIAQDLENLALLNESKDQLYALFKRTSEETAHYLKQWLNR